MRDKKPQKWHSHSLVLGNTWPRYRDIVMQGVCSMNLKLLINLKTHVINERSRKKRFFIKAWLWKSFSWALNTCFLKEAYRPWKNTENYPPPPPTRDPNLPSSSFTELTISVQYAWLSPADNSIYIKITDAIIQTFSNYSRMCYFLYKKKKKRERPQITDS